MTTEKEKKKKEKTEVVSCVENQAVEYGIV